MSFADSFGSDQSVFNRLVHRRKGKAGDSRDLGRRISIVPERRRHQSLFYPEVGRLLVGPWSLLAAWTKRRAHSEFICSKPAATRSGTLKTRVIDGPLPLIS